MTDPASRNGPTLREYFEGLFGAHKELHADHEKAHGREHEFAAEAIKTAAELAKQTKDDANEWRDAMRDREAKFATKEDVHSQSERIDRLEDAEIKRAENERLRLLSEVEAREAERERRRRELAVWSFGGAMLAVLINIIIRLASAPPTGT